MRLTINVDNKFVCFSDRLSCEVRDVGDEKVLGTFRWDNNGMAYGLASLKSKSVINITTLASPSGPAGVKDESLLSLFRAGRKEWLEDYLLSGFRTLGDVAGLTDSTLKPLVTPTIKKSPDTIFVPSYEKSSVMISEDTPATYTTGVDAPITYTGSMSAQYLEPIPAPKPGCRCPACEGRVTKCPAGCFACQMREERRLKKEAIDEAAVSLWKATPEVPDKSPSLWKFWKWL